MSAMGTVATSRASATQRTGRAGRVAPGVCYRLYSKAMFEAMPERPTPEIQRTALEATCLQAVSDLGVAMLSVAHRESVQRFHQQMLAVGHGGQLELTIIGVDGDEEDIRC